MAEALSRGTPLVSVVDDDESVRESLDALLRSAGWHVQAFASGEHFLDSDAVSRTACLVLDVEMPPGMSGPELHRELLERSHDFPVIFITGHRDETLRERVMAAGATDFFRKPFDEEALLSRIDAAVHPPA